MPATSQPAGPSPRRRPRTRRLLAAAAGFATVGALAAALPADAHEATSKAGGHLPSRYISADIPNAGTESPMGDLIADAQLAYGKELDPETDLALMNPGGVRAGLTYAAKGGEGDGVVTYAEGFTVQPFSNTVNRHRAPFRFQFCVSSGSVPGMT